MEDHRIITGHNRRTNHWCGRKKLRRTVQPLALNMMGTRITITMEGQSSRESQEPLHYSNVMMSDFWFGKGEAMNNLILFLAILTVFLIVIKL